MNTSGWTYKLTQLNVTQGHHLVNNVQCVRLGITMEGSQRRCFSRCFEDVNYIHIYIYIFINMYRLYPNFHVFFTLSIWEYLGLPVLISIWGCLALAALEAWLSLLQGGALSDACCCPAPLVRHCFRHVALSIWGCRYWCQLGRSQQPSATWWHRPRRFSSSKPCLIASSHGTIFWSLHGELLVLDHVK